MEIEYSTLKNNIKRNGMHAMLPLYRAYRSQYLSFCKKYSYDKDICLQSFNDAIVQMYRVLVKNQFDPNKSQLKTFLFNIGKNNLLNLLKKENTYQKHFKSNAEEHHNLNNEVIFSHKEQDDSILKKKLESVFDSLSEKCQTLIMHFYYDGLDSEEIMKLMNYDSTNVVYSAKSRCLKKLRELIKKSSERT